MHSIPCRGQFVVATNELLLCACNFPMPTVLILASSRVAVSAIGAEVYTDSTTYILPYLCCVTFCARQVPPTDLPVVSSFVIVCSQHEDQGKHETLLVLCASELAQLYTIIAADKAGTQHFDMCVLLLLLHSAQEAQEAAKV